MLLKAVTGVLVRICDLTWRPMIYSDDICDICRVLTCARWPPVLVLINVLMTIRDGAAVYSNDNRRIQCGVWRPRPLAWAISIAVNAVTLLRLMAYGVMAAALPKSQRRNVAAHVTCGSGMGWLMPCCVANGAKLSVAWRSNGMTWRLAIWRHQA